MICKAFHNHAKVTYMLPCLQVHWENVFSPEEVQPVLLPLLTNLFAAFSKPESEENPYVMKCVMRVIVFTGPQVGIPYLCEVISSPRKPTSLICGRLLTMWDCLVFQIVIFTKAW